MPKRRYRVPAEITGPYAARVAGEWSSHRTAEGAWRRAWPPRGGSQSLVLRLTGEGYGEPVEPPEGRPAGMSGPSGQHRGVRIKLTVSPEQLRRWDRAARAAGLPRSKWAEKLLDLGASEKSS